jgi:chemotaxis protein MotB
MIRQLTIGLMFATLVGCIGRGKHEIVEVQLEATRYALSSRTAACNESVAERDDVIAGLEEKVLEHSLFAGAQAHRIEALEEELAKHATEVADTATPDERIEAAVSEVRDALGALSAQRAASALQSRLRDQVFKAFEALRATDKPVTVNLDDTRWAIRLPSDRMFNHGTTDLSPFGLDLLTFVLTAIETLDGWELVVEGHTDDQPRHSVAHPSNWELGFDQAMAVLRVVEERGVTKGAAASFAGTRPIIEADSADARKTNRRIELVLTPPAPEPPPPPPELTPDPAPEDGAEPQPDPPAPEAPETPGEPAPTEQ